MTDFYPYPIYPENNWPGEVYPVKKFFRDFIENLPIVHENIIKEFQACVFPNIQVQFLKNKKNQIVAFSAHTINDSADLTTLNSIKTLVEKQFDYGVPSVTILSTEDTPEKQQAYNSFFERTGHTVQLVDLTWIAYVPYVFQMTKNAKKKLIEFERDIEINSGIVWNNHKWDTDEVSRNNLTSAVSIFNANGSVPENFVWRDSEKQNVPLSLPELNNFAAEVATKVNSAYTKSWQRKAAVDAATTQEEVDAA